MSQDTPAKPKRKRRWWVRVIRAGLLLLLVFVLLLSAGLWWAYSRRVVLLNNALASVGPMRASVGGLEVTRSGGLEVRDLVFTDRATGAVVARLPHVSGQANMAKLPPEEITSITLRNPEIILNAALIENWRKQAAAPVPGAGPTAPAIPFGLRFAKVNIEDAQVRFEHTDGTRAEMKVNYKGEDINVLPTGLATGNQDLTLEAGVIHAPDGSELPFELHKLHLQGRIRDGIVEVKEIDLDKPGLHVTPELLTMFGLNFSASPAGQATDAKPASQGQVAASTVPPASLVRGVRIENAKLSEVVLSARGFASKNASGLILPDTHALINYEAQGIEWHEGAPPVITSQKMELRDVAIEAPNDNGHLRFNSASFVFDANDEGTLWTLDGLLLAGPDLRWTPQLRQLLTSQPQGTQAPAPADAGKAAPPTAAPAPSPPPKSRALPQILLKQGSITDAIVSIVDPETMSFELHTKGALMLANLLIDGDLFRSQSFQTLEVTEGRLVFPSPEGQPAKKPWLELPHGEMVVKPDDWSQQTRIARLALDKLVVRLRDGNTPWISSQLPVQASGSEPQATTPKTDPAADPKTADREPETGNAQPPWWKRINCGQLSLTQGVADMVLDLPKPVDMQAQVDITTQRTPEGGSQHTVKIANFMGKLPTLSPTPFPVAQVRLIEGVVRLPEMWTQRRLDELSLTGASVDFSESLMKLFEPDKVAATAGDAAPATAPAKPDEIVLTAPDGTVPKTRTPWEVGRFSVQESSITISNLVPGMPAVKFGVALDVKDTPLLAEDLAADVAPQRVEMSEIKIPSPNGTARYVAELDSIFVYFSLAGLMRKEIDRVEIVSPTLFVGEDLFWYVDFYRKYAERGARPAPAGPQIAAVDEELDFQLGAVVAEAEPPISQAAWSVKRLQVHSGKLVIAPKGVPLKGVHTPFPFQIDSEVKRGTLVADLQIPTDTYELPDLNLQFQDMHGRVQFNLPIKQKDNNLTETFEVASVRWKKLRTGKAFLSVTYDKAGIYAKFGAEAYEGYIEGQANVYTDDSFHWDGWLSGTDVQTRDLTRILSPGYFLMDGRVGLTLVAQGSKSELYQADLTFKNSTNGKFTISGINGLINDLPKDWDPIKAQITKIGLETMRDFEYHRAEMKCRFYGREGNAILRFAGPTGSRNFDINVYDHRWKVDEKNKVTTSIQITE